MGSQSQNKITFKKNKQQQQQHGRRNFSSMWRKIGKKYVLGAIENMRKKGKQIATFYGSTDPGETFLQTAIREAEEESLAIFGTRNELLQLIQQKPVNIYRDCYYNWFGSCWKN